MTIVSYEDTNIPTPDEIRNRWCFGLPLSQENGDLMTDEDLKQFVKAAIQFVERKLGIYLKPTIIACNPEERGLIEGADYEVAEPSYDYHVKEYSQWGFMQLRERPVQEVTGLKLVLPNGNIIVDFMRKTEWIKLYPRQGQLHIVPYAGDTTLFALLGGTQSGYPFVTGSINSNLPQMLYVDYVAGLAQNKIPEDIHNVIAKLAAIDALGIAGDAVMAGIGSVNISLDGLSEGFTSSSSAEFGTYSSHTIQYQKEVDAFFSPKNGGGRTTERGFTFTVL